MLPCLLAALLLTTGCGAKAAGTELAVLKIGKADAIILLSDGHAVLIDAGEEDDATEILEFFEKRGIASIDAMIITHYDKDHVGGASGVLRGIDVAAVYDADYESDKEHYPAYLDALDETKTPRTRVAQRTELTLGGLTLALLPTAIESGDDNDSSLVVSARDAWHSYLFAADATEERIDELLADGIGSDDVLKMPHHGRYEDNLAALLDAVTPRLAIITDSDKNPADERTLALLEAYEIHTCATRDGDIHVMSDDKGLRVDQ